ncbi:hypothetical protein D9C73_028375 [Collichthys lucidus]|uniref:Uncharacterized protein n=1 Tax=Collichthys lucidus TaxID=240159 RepID=A0A4U5TW55_COLLU|nr:hypothetical protein D9C73_028375 [Collichthys lucidus]
MSLYRHEEITRWTVLHQQKRRIQSRPPPPAGPLRPHLHHAGPAYRPLLRRHTPTQRTITVWPSDAALTLQDCFQRTDWQIFSEAAALEGQVDLEEYTSAVLGYISKCAEDVTTTRTITVYPNQKPWLNAEVRSLLKARDAAFRSGDRLALRATRRRLIAGVKRAKATYARRIEGHFTSNDPRSMWRDIKCITDYSTRDAQCPRDPSLPDALNTFYVRFDDPNTSPSTRLTPPPGKEPLSVTPAEISVFEAMPQRPGRYSQVTKRKIEENSFQGVPLHTGQASDRNLDQREFFGSLARNLEKCMLSQGKDQRGYNKLIDDLKVLYPQYWPQDAAALFGEGEVETLCQKFGIENPRNAIRAYRE